MKRIFSTKHVVSHKNIEQVLELLEETGARAYAQKTKKAFALKAKKDVEKTSMPKTAIKTLQDFVDLII